MAKQIMFTAQEHDEAMEQYKQDLLGLLHSELEDARVEIRKKHFVHYAVKWHDVDSVIRSLGMKNKNPF